MQKMIRWLPWGQEAFQKAKQEQKPVFLHIGFPSCHWCHVMEAEAFGDAQVVQILNDSFICIHVDREQRPDIDAIYMTACQVMTGQGGWPLIALLNAAQQPFFIATYMKQAELLTLLQETIQYWSKHRDRFTNMGAQLSQAVREQFSQATPQVDVETRMMEQAVRAYTAAYDAQWGGIGYAPKFPMPQTLLFLLRQYAVTKDRKALQMAEHTLMHMCEGAIFDHIGGGFMRYATDRQWAKPHFEKMLNDNALLIQVYIEAWQITGRAIYRNIAERTLAYISAEMTDKEGAFYGSQDADAQGIEGAYYQFTKKELCDLLGKENGEAYVNYYSIENTGHPNRIGHSGGIVTQKMDLLNETVFAYRMERMPLKRDEKIVTVWNAMMIQSYVTAYLAFDEKQYLDKAINAAEFLRRKILQPNGTLRICWFDGEATGEGLLDDYAQLAMAALLLYRATLEDRWLTWAVHLSRMILERFEDKENGGFYMTPHGGEKAIARPKEVYDASGISGNAAALSVFVTLSMLDVGEGWADAAARQMSFLSGFIASDPLHHMSSLLYAMPLLYPVTLLDAQADTAENQKLLDALRGQYTPFLYVKAIPPGLHGNLWCLCKGTTCLAPFQEMEALLAALP